jgi:hypothetical protein
MASLPRLSSRTMLPLLLLSTTAKRYRPHTKHLSFKWHHFRDQVKKGWLNVQKVGTEDNWADTFTQAKFCILCDKLMGWSNPRKRSRQSIPGIPAHAVPEHAAAAFAHASSPNRRRSRKRQKLCTHRFTLAQLTTIYLNLLA